MLPADDLKTFLERQAPSTLVQVLLELAQDHDAVQARLDRLKLAGQPRELAAGFRKTLNVWRRSSEYITYRDASDFGREMETWLDQVERELLPLDPAAALQLFEGFIESDGTLFERADDSDGCIGDAVRSACRHWLTAAARCESPAGEWPDRLVRLVLADEYGARDELLRRADILIDADGLGVLVERLEQQLDEAQTSSTHAQKSAWSRHKISAALALLSDALRDPDVEVRNALKRNPQPNPVQQQAFAEAYLKAGRPTDALRWLQEPWGHMEVFRHSLTAQALTQLGRLGESATIRQQIFENSLEVYDLQEWLEVLPNTSKEAALQHARRLALDHADPVAAARILLEVEDPVCAEDKLVSESSSIRGGDYGVLVPLAESLQARRLFRGEAAVYRALLTDILARAYVRAYRHAARFLHRLREIDDAGVDLAPLDSHEAFEAAVRTRHGRKVAFWAHVNGDREDPHDAEE